MKRWFAGLAVAVMMLSVFPESPIRAEESPGSEKGAAPVSKDEPTHNELRQLMKDLLAAYNAHDHDKLVSFLDEHCSVTWQNGKVNAGPKEVREFLKEMTSGPNKVVESSTMNPVVDDLSQLYSDGTTAVARGKSLDHYKLTDGTEFDQDTRWSATVVKKDGQWKIANVHISTNVFDNAILRLAVKKTALWAGGAGIVLGAVLGAVVVWLSRRSKTNPLPGTA